MAAEPQYPEHEKLLARRDARDTLGEFYDWLQSEGIMLARYGAPKSRTKTCPRCNGTGVDMRDLTNRQKQLLKNAALPDDRLPPCDRCQRSGKIIEEYVDEDKLFPIHEPPVRLFARFFDIDLDRFHAEKEEMLDALRAANASRDAA